MIHLKKLQIKLCQLFIKRQPHYLNHCNPHQTFKTLHHKSNLIFDLGNLLLKAQYVDEESRHLFFIVLQNRKRRQINSYYIKLQKNLNILFQRRRLLFILLIFFFITKPQEAINYELILNFTAKCR